MTSRYVVSAIGFVLAVAAAGCSSSSLQWPRWLSPGWSTVSESQGQTEPPPTAVTPPPDTSVAAPRAIPPPSGPRPSEKETDTTTPPKQVIVTLGESREPGLQAEGVVNAAYTRLMKVDRSRLTPESAALYDQASTFVGAARKSVADKDYPAAEGFARKASTLLTKLESDTPNR